jgi:hypothetical protein
MAAECIMRAMRRMLSSAALVVALQGGACAAHPGTSTAKVPISEEPAAPDEPPPALMPLEPLFGDWKRADGGETHYVFAGDAVFGVSFTGESFEVSITTAEPKLKTRVYKDGASEVASDGAPSSEGLTRIHSERAPAIEDSEHHFAEASSARGVGGWVDWFDEHGAQWDEGEHEGEGKRIEGKAAIKEYMTPLLSRPSFRLEWKPIISALAPGGALGYTVGTWEGVVLGEGGQRVVKRHGAFVTVWKRQADGSWRVLFDTGDPVS